MPKPLFDEEMLGDWEGFYKEVTKQNDLTAALLCAANLSSRLAQLIVNFIVDDKKLVHEFMHPDEGNAPLSTFGGRITGAYCMGLIDKRNLKELRWIKKVRNKFAHGMHGVTFADEEIVK
jgi:DNA-binding MltR family transcriptional regulator